MNWLLQEEEADVVRLKDTSHVLAEEIDPEDLLRLPIDAEELDESEHDERHRIIMKELYPDLPTPQGGLELVEEFPWEVPDEGDTLDFDEWERALEEKKKNPGASSAHSSLRSRCRFRRPRTRQKGPMMKHLPMSAPKSLM